MTVGNWDGSVVDWKFGGGGRREGHSDDIHPSHYQTWLAVFNLILISCDLSTFFFFILFFFLKLHHILEEY